MLDLFNRFASYARTGAHCLVVLRLEHGQHVSFFALSTLEYIADRMSLHLSSDGISFHVLTREKLPMRVFRRIDSRLWRALFSRTRQRASKSEADHELVSTIRAQAAPQS